MMTGIDLTQINRDDLIELILDQAQQAAKLQAEFDELKLKLDKTKSRPVVSKISLQPLSTEQKDIVKHEQRLPQAYAGHETPLPPQVNSNIDNKPKWMTKNRLQNCHAPKQK